MADDVDERIVLASSTIIFSSCAIFLELSPKEEKASFCLGARLLRYLSAITPLTAFSIF